jgi:hypothetical protein
MFTSLQILLAAWLVLNVVVLLLAKRRAHLRGDRPATLPRGGRSYAAAVDGYGSLLLFRVLVQTCRVVGAPEACLFLRDPAQPDALVPVASHGLDEGVLGRRIDSDEGDWQLELAAADGTPIDTGVGVAAPVVRATIGECGYLWAAAGPAGRLGDRQIRLLGELAELCAQALDDLERGSQLDEVIGAALTLLTMDDDRATAGRHAALAVAVGERLGMDASALIELDMAARVQHAVPVAPAEAVRALPGFESVAIALRFAHERWDGRGPQGLRGDRIPLSSRVLAACEQIGMRFDAGLRTVQGASGSRFDPSVVAALSQELLGPLPEFEQPVTEWADGDEMFSGLAV